MESLYGQQKRIIRLLDYIIVYSNIDEIFHTIYLTPCYSWLLANRIAILNEKLISILDLRHFITFDYVPISTFLYTKMTNLAVSVRLVGWLERTIPLEGSNLLTSHLVCGSMFFTSSSSSSGTSPKKV